MTIRSGLALSVLLQGAVLLFRYPVPARWQFQTVLLALAAAGLVCELWHNRRYLSPHIDMLLLMAGFGGLGMAVGNWPFTAGLPACHADRPLAWAAMSAGMLLAAYPVALRHARCLLRARAVGVLVPTLILDASGMLLGMAAGHFLATVLPIPRAALPLAGHGFMLGGMLLGMAAVMPASRTVALVEPLS